jgi:cobalt/nickel transport system permease protein
MSHIHIPDGILPIWLLLLGWLLTCFFLFLSIKRLKKTEITQKLPFIGIVSAIMIVAMMLEIVPIAYHFNLSVIAGIILGPAMAFIAVFIVDLIIAMFGHGGITVIGLNTLVVGLEAVAGYYFFHLLLKTFKHISNSHAYSAFIATFLSLVLSCILMIGFVSVSNLNPSIEKINSIKDQNVFLEKTDLLTHNHGKNEAINVYRFSKTVILMSFIGWILEALITGFVIKYIHRIRPPLILNGLN